MRFGWDKRARIRISRSRRSLEFESRDASWEGPRASYLTGGPFAIFICDARPWLVDDAEAFIVSNNLVQYQAHISPSRQGGAVQFDFRVGPVTIQ